MAKERVEVEIVTDTKGSQSSLKKYAMALGVASVAVGAAIKVAKDLVNAYSVQEDAERSLEQAIRTTGRTAEISSDEMFRYAAELQQITTYGDEVTISAMAMMQQLADLDQQGLKRVTPSVMDFAAAMDMDLNSAASLVGRTLSGTTNLLTRYGIDLDMTGTKTERLAQLTEVLDSKFGGMAEAMAETTAGASKQLSNALGDLQEALGASISQGWEPASRAMTSWVTKATEAINAAREVREETKELRSQPGATTEQFFEADPKMAERWGEVIVGQLKQARDLGMDMEGQVKTLAKSYELSYEYVSGLAVEHGVITQEAADAFGWVERQAKEAERLAEAARLEARGHAQGAAERERLAEQLRKEIEAQEYLNDLIESRLTDEQKQLRSLQEEIEIAVEMRDVFAEGSEEWLLAESQVKLLAAARTELRLLIAEAKKGEPVLAELWSPGTVAGAGTPGSLGLDMGIGPGLEELAAAFEHQGATLSHTGKAAEAYLDVIYRLSNASGTLEQDLDAVGDVMKDMAETYMKDLAFNTMQAALGFNDLESGLAGYFGSLMANMDRMLFDMAWAAFKSNKFELGVALLAASGLVALGKAWTEQLSESPNWVLSGNPGSASPIRGGNMTVYNVEGSLVREADLDNRIMEPVQASGANH